MAIFSFQKKKNTSKHIQNLKTILGVIVSLVIIISASYIYASSKKPYEITSYDVNIEVSEDNVLHITETITAYFNTSKHGIVRVIPLNGTLNRYDNDTSNYRAKVSNISVNENFTKNTTYGNNTELELTIGNPNRTITGEKKYVISYDYKYSSNTKDYDELYYNIIGPDWDTTIDNITFSIKMPKDFDESKLGFTYGKVNEDLTGNVEYEINENVISGKLNEKLNSYEAFTVRLELPDGYFVIPESTYYYKLGIIVIFVIIIAVSFVMWFKFGRDKKVVETVEFYPPENLNSLETAFAYKASASSEDITSLLIYLANKKYLKIEEYEEQNVFFKTDSFKIIKLKDYDGDNTYERKFFNGLFKKGDEVTLKDLRYKFYRTQDDIRTKINSKKNKEKIIDKKSSKCKTINGFLIFGVILSAIIYCFYIMNIPIFPNVIFLLIPIFFAVMFISIIISSIRTKKLGGIITGIIMTLFGLFMLSPFFSIVILSMIGQLETVDWIVVVSGVVTVVILLILNSIMTARTTYGCEILGKIRGFKRFLENARKDELEQLVMQTPSYFYDILPYTYVLGISKKWISKFEEINIEPPTWYGSTSTFNVITFGNSINRALSDTNSVMSSSPSSSGSSSSGGGFSGGGHSGGGAGGGGGRSW